MVINNKRTDNLKFIKCMTQFIREMFCIKNSKSFRCQRKKGGFFNELLTRIITVQKQQKSEKYNELNIEYVGLCAKIQRLFEPFFLYAIEQEKNGVQRFIFFSNYSGKNDQMSSFQENAALLVEKVREIRMKKKALGNSIQEDRLERAAIQEELSLMEERKKEIESLIKNYKVEKDNLERMINQTEETKEKIAESLKHLNIHLKKMQFSHTNQ